MITNLVGNAIKFTEQGSVTVAVSAVRGKRSMLRVEVRDTGIGMTADQVERSLWHSNRLTIAPQESLAEQAWDSPSVGNSQRLWVVR